MKNFGTIIDNFDAVTKQYVDDKASTKRIKGIKVDNATLADTAKKVQNAFTYKAHNKAAGTVVPITYDGSKAASLDFSANDFTYDYSSGKDIKIKLVDKDYATMAQVNAKYTKPESGIPKSDLATSVQTSLDKADSALQSAPVTSVNGKTGAVQLGASDVGALPTSTKYVVSVNGESGEVKNIAKTNSANTFTGDQTVTGNGSVTGNLTVGANLTVNGTTTTVDSTTLQVKDKLIEVAHGNTTTLTTPAGLVAPKYDGTNSGALVFDSTGTAYVGDVTLKDGNIDVVNSGLQPLATRTGLVGGNLVQYDSSALTLKDSGKKISDLALKTDISGKLSKTENTGVNVLGTTKATTTLGGNQLVAPNGIIFAGTAANAGLVTRGICGVSTPDSNGACSKENLYINYDGNNDFNAGRQVVLNAGAVGNHLGSNMYQYAVPRGDIVKAWVESKGYATSVKVNGNTIASSGGVVDIGTVLTDASKFATSAQGSNADSALAKANANATEISNIKNGTNGTKVKYAEHADAADSATSAGTADKVANGLTIANATFDGSKPLTIGTSDKHIEIMGGSAASPHNVTIGLKYGNLMPSSYNKVTVDGYGIVTDGENIDYLTSHQSIKSLKTDNTESQAVNPNEAIAGSGTINLHKVAKTGSYNDLLYTPTIPAAANNGKLTIQKNGTDVATFGANQKDSITANITVPTKASDVNALSLDGGTINKSKTIKMDASANSNGANLKWGTVNSKNPYIGYASDQVDGTFVVGSLLGTNYASGLAIGGGSGNLLWKGTKVATTSDIPTVNNGTLTIQKNGTNVATFSANQSTNSTANITVPVKVSELTNDSGYTTNKGTVTQVKINGATKSPDSAGLVDLGTGFAKTADLPIKSASLSGTTLYLTL